MAVPLVAALAPAALNFVGGLLGRKDKSAAQKKADAIQAQIMAEIDALEIPSIDKQKIVLERLYSAGVLTPQLQQLLEADPSALSMITTNPDFEAAQLDSLGALQEIAEGGGRTAQEERDLAEVEGDLKAKGAGVREGIIQEYEEKGRGGSTNELLQLLLAEQGEQTERAEAGRDLRAEAEERSLEAIIQAGELGGDIRTQEFDEKSEIARAEDEIERFNVGLERDITGENIDRQNRADEQNLQAGQDLINSNVALTNEAEKHNKKLIADHYAMKLEKMRLKTGALNTNKTDAINAGNSDASDTGNMFNTGAKILDVGIDQYYDKKKKKD